MDALSKRSYFRFLALYLVSSFVLLGFASYFFYQSRVSMGKQTFYYKMVHIADMQGLSIIDAYMKRQPLKLLRQEGFSIALFDAHKKLVAGKTLEKVYFGDDFYTKNGITTLISTSSAMHHGIKYVVVQTDLLAKNKRQCLVEIVTITLLIAVVILIIAAVLSWVFLKPLKERAKEIERFVKDTTHELNTPISAMMMSLERLRKKRSYDEKIVTNLRISTQNLFEIYESLTFISFSQKKLADEKIDFADVVQRQLESYTLLAQKKRLLIKSDLKPTPLTIAPIKAKMLISNLLSNAIKYSHPGKTITVTLKNGVLSVEDEGIGIEEEKLKTIFERFTRANDYAGGFGVGLSIVKQIAEEYGFHVAIDSLPNKGTTVKVVLQ